METKDEHLAAIAERGSVARASFNRMHDFPTGKRGSFSRASFAKANLQMIPPDTTHLEMVDEVADDSIENVKTGPFVWLCAFAASIAGSLFGYDTGIISAVLVYLHTDLDNREMGTSEKEAITSLCSAGAFVGAILAGLTADKFGRKGAIYVGCVLFLVGAILQAVSWSFAQMCVGRLVVGFGVGSAAMVVPLYIAELAPANLRGRMIGLNNMSITGGQVISYGVGAAFANVDHGWREEATRVIQRIYKHATPEQVQAKVNLIDFIAILLISELCFIPINTDTLELEDRRVSAPAIVVLVFIICTDFFRMEVRAMGTMWMTCCNWAPNVIVSSTFLSMMKGITPSGAFGFYAAVCGIGWLLIIFFYPEVSGLTLEETHEVFQHGFGVRYARKLRKERKDVIKARKEYEKRHGGGTMAMGH
ncbi:hypothetical protein H2201_007124 [Coniosporium apollinis]|uniref:Major facilitator superfamily (MFS) profile domain-containing protein n=1 Tax=Coniosporium apollinis TaxID=61459 RepID=A0ABQ9NJY6_9PEZI|nr:hypothetical protein H2201_007124 [Coniosporium apollinis]